jgi:hypothetical protein
VPVDFWRDRSNEQLKINNMNQYKQKHLDITLIQYFQIEKLIEKVQNELGILKDEKKPKAVDTFERYAMVYVLIKHFSFRPLPVSKHLAKNNHTLISYMMKQANDWMDVNKDFKELVEKIKETLK